MTNRALFLDRDGIINDLVFYSSTGEWESPRSAGDVRVLDGVREALQEARAAGWLLVIVSNQPSYAKGKMARAAIDEVQAEVVRQLDGLAFDGVYLCIHHPQAILEELAVHCECRKPGSGSLLDAERELLIDLKSSWMIGDCDTDIVAGRAAGCRTALLQYARSSPRRGREVADMLAFDLSEVVRKLIRQDGSN